MQTLTTNSLFLRSSTGDTIPSDAATVWLDHCAPVHAELITIVKPRVIVCFGIASWTYLTGRGDPGHWDFNPDLAFRLHCVDPRCGLLLLPHFSSRAAATWTKYAPTLERAQEAARAYAQASM